MNTDDFKAVPKDVHTQYQSERSFHPDWQTVGVAISPAGGIGSDVADDLSLAMRQFYQSPNRALG